MLEHLLELSLLNLNPKKKKKIIKDLEKILNYFSQIKNIKTRSSKLSKEFFEANLKEDLANPISETNREKILQLAPKKEKGFFKTKAIF